MSRVLDAEWDASTPCCPRDDSEIVHEIDADDLEVYFLTPREEELQSVRNIIISGDHARDRRRDRLVRKKDELVAKLLLSRSFSQSFSRSFSA